MATEMAQSMPAGGVAFGGIYHDGQQGNRGVEPEAGRGGNCQRPALKNSSLLSQFYNLERCLCQALDIRYSNTWTYGGHCRFKP